MSSSDFEIDLSFRTHLCEKFAGSFHQRLGDTSVSDVEIVSAAGSLLNRVIEFVRLETSLLSPRECKKMIYARAEQVNKHILSGEGEELKCLLDACGESAVDIASICRKQSSRSQHNQEIFDTIASRHREVADMPVWQDSLANNRALASYARAAQCMGEKPWVIAGYRWMECMFISYFCEGGAKEHFLKGFKRRRAELSLPALSSSELQLVQALLQRNLLSSPASSSDCGMKRSQIKRDLSMRLRVVDVGSCFSPFAGCDSRDAIDVIALDLCPARAADCLGVVYQCDFLSLRIGDENSVMETEGEEETKRARGSSGAVVTGNQQESSPPVLRSLPSSSAEIVTISLVLSYLPSPYMRLQMIRRARCLLKDPSSDPRTFSFGGDWMSALSPWSHHSGLLLIYEKESIFHSEKYFPRFLDLWKRTVQACGFELIKYERLITPNMSKGKRAAHAFAFRTIPFTKDDNYREEESLLWIKQDFDSVREAAPHSLQELFPS